MSGSGEVLISKGVRLHYDRLCVAVREQTQPHHPTAAQLEALAELQACRAQIASPLDPKNERPPSHQDRSRLTISDGITVLANSDTSHPESEPIPIRLGSDLVSVAVALSDELHMNEVDAAILLYDARVRAARRSDHDVVSAAKEIFVARRRESILYLQEIIRAGLNHAEEILQLDNFISSLLKERDLLLTDHNVFQNIVDRLNDALQVLESTSNPIFRHFAASEERLLLAETLFLLAYTVQLNPSEASCLYSLLLQVHQACDKFCNADSAEARRSKELPNFAASNVSSATGSGVRLTAVDKIRLKSVRNILFLAWTTALDRSRYHNIYNPRTGNTGVNELLRDPAFVHNTSHVPRLVDGEEDTISARGSILAAAELSAALFRLAVAIPDEDEAVTTFLRASAFGNAFYYLSNELIDWIRHGAGSLSPDTDLYADVIEDLALDIAEAPRLVAALIQFTQNETYELAANVAFESLRTMSSGRGPETTLANPDPAGPDARRTFGESSLLRRPLHDAMSTKPPPHPRTRRGSKMIVQSLGNDIAGSYRPKAEDSLLGNSQVKSQRKADDSCRPSAASLVSFLARFVARAVSAAPAKLQCDSVGGGLRYWVGIGQSSIGFIPRIGDAVIDMWDTAMRNPNAPGNVGMAFRQALQGFLLLLRTTSQRQGSPAHAAASLKYLQHGGHPVASLERATGAVSYIADSFSMSPSDIQIDDAEANALRGILDVISSAAEALESHGGVMPILQDSGRDLASRLSTFVIFNIPLQLRQSALNCLRALNYSRTVPVLIETLSAEKCAVLRHWARAEEAPSKSFSVTTSAMRLVKRCVAATDTCSDKTLEVVALFYIIDEVLSFWNRRVYACASQRWEVLATACEILVQLLTKDPSSSLSQQIAISLLQPSPGTGSASYAFQSLCVAAGLVSKEEQLPIEYRKSWDLVSPETGRIVSGRELLTRVILIGEGDTYRWMRKAVFYSSQLLSLLLMVSPGRLSKSAVVTASAVDLLAGEPECLISASSLVYAPDGYDAVLNRAAYGMHLSATILNMLGRAAHGSSLIASILTKEIPGSSASPAQFRASLSRILLDSPANIGGSHLDSAGTTSSSERKEYFEDPVLHSVLRIVEACLGPDGCAAPGMFLLGFPTDAMGRRTDTEHGILGSLIELVAGANPFQPLDDAFRSTAATFLERLVSHTVKTTSSAVLEHIRSISAADSSVRGGGFADEMLLRMIEDMQDCNKTITTGFDWSSFAMLMSACMKLSALQVRFFPEHERGIYDGTTTQYPVCDDTSGVKFANLPSPSALLEVLSRAAGTGDQTSVSDAFGAWNKLIGIRLSIHSDGKGYANESTLFDLVVNLLTALSSDSHEHGLEALAFTNFGETACATVLDCISKLVQFYESGTQEGLQAVTEDQFVTIIDGVYRALVSLSKAGSRAEKARTFLYGTLLSSCLVPGAGVSNMFSKALSKSSLDVRAIGVETVINVACSDALVSHSSASKSASIALISRLVACEPSRALQALAKQNRFRRIVMASFSNIVTTPPTEKDSQVLKMRSENRADAAVAQAVLSLIQVISVTASGGRLLGDSGCIEAFAQILASYESGRLWTRPRRPATQYVAASDLETSHRYLDVPTSSAAASDEPKTWQKTLFNSLARALATAVRCGGENVVEDVVYALGKGRSVFLDILRTLHLPDAEELKSVCALGMTLSRIPPYLVSAAVTCSQLRTNLASIVGKILPPLTKSQRLGGSGSVLSAGINLKHPDTARTTRRMRIVHPEGGSLYERDVVRARAIALRNVFSTLTQQTALPFLFSPDLSIPRSEHSLPIADRIPVPTGSLAEVLRIAQAMIREHNRSKNESIHLDRQAAGDARAAISARAEAELSQFCEEEYGLRSESLDYVHVKGCLKKEAVSANRHAAVCIRILEMALIILREYVFNAVDISRGKPVLHGEIRNNADEVQNGTGHHITVDRASSFIADAGVTLIPFCKEVENIQDGTDDTAGTFSRQVCRQIRTACPS